MNILAIGAHPDDLEIYCFGTLAKYVKLGHKVFTSSIANGNLGHYEIKPPELAEIRKQETTSAAEIIGAQYIAAVAGDLCVNSHDEAMQKKVVDMIRAVEPDLIITHDPNDYMPDHVETSKLVFYASFGSSIPNYKTETPYHDAVVPIYYMETATGINFVPQEYVNITDTISLKVKAIECHDSQLAWLKDHDGFDMLEFAKISAQYRGMQCGAKFAEGFRQCMTWPRVISNRLLP